MKNTYLSLLLIATLFTLNITRSEAQSEGFIKAEEVPEEVIQKMDLLYPDQDKSMMVWEFEHGGYEAYLKNKENPNEDVVFFSAEGYLEYRINTSGKGSRTGTEKEIKSNSLPEIVSELCEGKVVLAIVELLSLEEITTGYRLYIESGEQLKYNNKGEFIL